MSGGPNNVRSPPRTPNRVPHPKPGTPSIWSMIKNQGDNASQKLSIPILGDFIMLASFVMSKTVAIALLIDGSRQSPPADSMCIPQDHHHLDHSLEDSLIRYADRDDVTPSATKCTSNDSRFAFS